MIPLSVVADVTTTPMPGFTQAEDPDMNATVTAVGAMPNATLSGNASVFVTLELPDGRTVMGQTTLALMHGAVTALAARHGLPA